MPEGDEQKRSKVDRHDIGLLPVFAGGCLFLLLLNYLFLVHVYANVPFQLPSGLGPVSLRSLVLFYIAVSSVLVLILVVVSKVKIERPLRACLARLNALAERDKADAADSISAVTELCENVLTEARERERAIADYSSDVLCSLTRDLTINSVSPSSLANWGYLPIELIGRPLSDLCSLDDINATAAAFEKVRQSLRMGIVENQLFKKNLQLIDVQWSIEWSESAGEFFAVCKDISAQKNLERAKNEFAIMINHDLRAPLTAILLNLSALAGEKGGALSVQEQQKVLKVSERSAARLITLLNELLDFEKSSSGELKLNCEPKDADSLIAQACEEVGGLALKKSIALEAEPSGGLMVQADSERLLRVFINLLSNAIKYSPPDSAVRVGTECAGKFVKFFIADQGEGIPPQYHSVVFEPYKQVGSDARKTGGTGLGLAICSVFVQAHGGKIGVTSQTGEGSTFWFTIPKAD